MWGVVLFLESKGGGGHWSPGDPRSSPQVRLRSRGTLQQILADAPDRSENYLATHAQRQVVHGQSVPNIPLAPAYVQRYWTAVVVM